MTPRTLLPSDAAEETPRRPPSGGTHIPVRTFGPPAPIPPPRPPARPPALSPPPAPHRRRRWTATVIGLLLVLVALGAAKVMSVGSAVLSSERPIIAQLSDLLFRRGVLLGERENRVNILVAAIGGEGHEGANLTDTIILASLRPEDKNMALLSIPRDLYVRVPGSELYTRINAIHARGEDARRGTGLALLKESIAEITGQPIHYVARADFTAFKRIVDEVGGIDITIAHGFYDYWHKISFPAGTEHMNGERALAYVRARFIEGPEGGDFKRAERTQQVLLAIRKKVLSLQTALDVRKLAGILDALRDNVATSFTLSDMKRLADLTRDITDEHIASTVLTTGPKGLLVGTTEILGGRPAAVLRPRAGLTNYGEIHDLVSDLFARARVAPPPTEAPPLPSPGEPTTAGRTVAEEQPTIEIRNGTAITGLAARTAKRLEKEDFQILAIGNATLRNRTETTIVDRTGGTKPTSLAALQKELGASRVAEFPAAEKSPADASFIVFLGTDVAERFK